MNRLFLTATILIAGSAASVSEAAGNPLQSALPLHARILASTAVQGEVGRTAVLFKLADEHVGVVETGRGHSRLIWSKPLLMSSPSLLTSLPPHVFAVKGVQGARRLLSVYELHGREVRSAIVGHSNGTVSADDGIGLIGNGFAVRNKDHAHVGSVAYRLVTKFQWRNNRYIALPTTRAPDYPPQAFPLPNGTIRTKAGDLLLLRLEVAQTEQMRELGLMYRKSLDPDAGMVFVWAAPVQDSFWMENTYVPLTVAFLDSTGRILEMQNMEPLTTVYHTPAVAYTYAIEVNQGYFATNGVAIGDVVRLHLR